MCILFQIIHASLEEGIKEARLLLHDWLVILTAQYNDFYKLARFGQSNTLSRLDKAFSQCSKLQVLPRLVFALLRNPLLQCHDEGVHPDYRIYLQCLFRYETYCSMQVCTIHRIYMNSNFCLVIKYIKLFSTIIL